MAKPVRTKVLRQQLTPPVRDDKLQREQRLRARQLQQRIAQAVQALDLAELLGLELRRE